MHEPPHPLENLRRVLRAGFLRQQMHRVFAQFLRQARAAQIENAVFGALQRDARPRLRVERPLFHALLKDLLQRHALVTELNDRTLIFADADVPRFLERRAAERPFPHNRLNHAVAEQIIQPPEDFGAGEQLRLGFEIHQCPLHGRSQKIHAFQRGEPVVNILHERRQRGVSDDADAIPA